MELQRPYVAKKCSVKIKMLDTYPDFTKYNKVTVIKAAWCRHNRYSDELNGIENPEINPHICQ